MRLTLAVCWRGQQSTKTFYQKPRDLTRQFRVQWRDMRRRKIPKADRLLQSLQSRGISVVKDPWNEMEQLYNPRLEVEEEEPKPRHSPHERSAVVWHVKSRILGGLEHAQVITKTVMGGTGLPERLAKLQGQEELPEQDKLVQSCLLNANVFDAVQEKLHKGVRFEAIPEQKLHHYRRREYGIPPTRKVFSTNWNLLRLCEALTPRYPKLQERTVIGGVYYSSLVERLGDMFCLTSNLYNGQFAVLSKQPLEPFASAQEVEQSCKASLPDIYPLQPSVNLFREKNYPDDTVFPVTPDCVHPHLHTVIFPYNSPINKGSESQLQGSCLLYCFMAAVCDARNKYGMDVKQLPDPVTLQCVYTDGHRFIFNAFQLNTLALNDNDGIKNMFWTEPICNIFDECGYKNEQPVIEGYNPAVMRKLIGCYINGAT